MNFNPSSSTFSICLSSLFTTPSHTLSFINSTLKANYWMEKYLLQTRLTPVCHDLFLETHHISIRLLDLLFFCLLVKNKTRGGGFWEPEEGRSFSPVQPWQTRVGGSRAKESRRIWASKEKPCYYMEYNFTRRAVVNSACYAVPVG